MLLVAYSIDPISFQEAWKGRAFYLFFLWLFALEFILGGRNPKSNRNVEWSRIAIGTFLLMIPTIYLIEAHIFNLNNTIIEFGKFLGVPPGWQLYDSWPLSVEYIIVTVSIFIGVLVLLNLEGIKQFSVSIFLLGAMGVFYMIDTFRPFETASFPNIFSLISPIFPQRQVAIQSFVPFTSSMVAFVLQKIGYTVQMAVLRQTGAVQMLVGGGGFVIYWPCAGVHSLFIYTFVILLFLKGSPMSLVGKAICLVVGAVGTFFANVLRIVSIIDIYIHSGGVAGEYFHNYYGELYFLAWIVIYLFALILVQRFLTDTRARAQASVALVGGGLGVWFFSGVFSFSLESTRLIVSIIGVGSIVAGLILGVYTYFAYRRRT
jgi:exosortase/archaeosortase family protein